MKKLEPYGVSRLARINMTQKSELGQLGEDLVCEYLVNKGYKLIARNFRRPWGELDIIVQDPIRVLVFVEVKTLKENKSLSPEENLTSAKLKKFKKAAMLFPAVSKGRRLLMKKKAGD